MWVDLAGLACCLALAGVGYVVAVIPVVRSDRHVSDLRVEILASEKRTEQLVHRSRGIDQRMDNVNEQLVASSLQLEPAALVNTRVNILTRMASESGLSLDAVVPNQAEKGSLYRTVPIRIQGKGEYPDVAVFLHRLRTELRDTTVRSLQLVNDPTGSERPSFVFDLVWYAAPEDRAG